MRRFPVRRSRAFVACAATAVLLVASGVVIWRLAPGGRAPRSLTLGVLDANPAYLAADTAAGIRLAVLNVSWAEWEPAEDATDTAYRRQIRAEVGRYRSAGWQVAVDPGLQDPPAWASRLRGALLEGAGGAPAASLDYEWSQPLRSRAGRYLHQLVVALGPVSYYRVGLNEHGEAHYPDTSTGQWWINGAGPQGHAASELPAGEHPTPMPGWAPGQATWDGHPVTVEQVTSWYGWYLGSMVQALRWEIDTYRAAGFTGRLQLVVPGAGVLPNLYASAVDNLLVPTLPDTTFVLQTGAVWWEVLADLRATPGLLVDISSVGDASGDPPANTCEAGDDTVALTSPAIWTWSDTRWLTYLARRNGFTVMGENPGDTPATSLPAIFDLARACHLVALQWAWDAQLRQAGSADLSQLQEAYVEVSR